MRKYSVNAIYYAERSVNDWRERRSMTSLASIWDILSLESLWAIDCYAINVLSSLLCLRELPNSENTIILDKEVTQMNYNENYIMWRHSRHDIMFVELVSLNRPYLRNYEEFWQNISLATSSYVLEAVWIFSECSFFFSLFLVSNPADPLKGDDSSISQYGNSNPDFLKGDLGAYDKS